MFIDLYNVVREQKEHLLDAQYDGYLSRSHLVDAFNLILDQIRHVERSLLEQMASSRPREIKS